MRSLLVNQICFSPTGIWTKVPCNWEPVWYQWATLCFKQFVNCHLGPLQESFFLLYPIQASTYFFAELLTDICAFFWWLLHCLDLSFKSIHFLMKFLLALPALFHGHVPHLITQTPETEIVVTLVLWPSNIGEAGSRLENRRRGEY